METLALETPKQNGVLRIATKGALKVQIGDGPQVQIDSCGCHNGLVALGRQYGADDDGVIPNEKIQEYHGELLKLVKKIAQTEHVTLAMALEFQAALSAEVTKLKPFFDASYSEKQSLPESSETADCSTPTTSLPEF